jgi:hypothetical protein
MVHRFDISCGGAGIAWMRVAAAMRQATSEPAWIEQGRLNVVWAAHNPSAHAPCLERPTYALGGMALERRVAYTGNCESRADDYEHVVLPAGFAPVDELGARIESAADASLSSELEEIAASFQPALAGLDEPVLALASPDDIVAPIPGLEPYDAEIDPVVADDWVTVVRSVQDYGIKKTDSTPDGPWTWLLALMAAATVLGLYHMRPSHSRTGPLFAFGGGLARFAEDMDRRWDAFRGRSAPESFINAGAAVKAMLLQTEDIVGQLKGGAPLRDVLRSELKHVRQALKNVESAARDSDEEDDVAAARSSAHYRTLVRELERIRRIAEGAAASLSDARTTDSVPRTTSEAYAVLGVNPEVNDGVLKKVVDGLRMSWHPDHARDDEDRLVREVRMRQINIAWDLIHGDREVA